MQRRFRGPPTAVIVIAVAVVQVVGTVFASARQPDHRPLDVLAFALLLLGPAALSLRRRAPLVMLPARRPPLCGVPGARLRMGSGVPVAGAGHRLLRGSRQALADLDRGGSVRRGAGGRVIRPRGDEAALLRAFAGTAWLAILVLLGEGARLRSERVAERRRQQEAREQAARDEYRLALARDIHDVVAHSLSMINVRASVALHLGDRDPEQFRPALEAIKAASKEFLDEVRQLLGVLRDDAPLSPAPAPRLRRIPELADNARRAGLEVSLSAAGSRTPPRSCPMCAGGGLPDCAGGADQRGAARRCRQAAVVLDVPATARRPTPGSSP